MEHAVVDFYTSRYNEHVRHQDAFGQIQQARTIQLLERYLPANGVKIADIGGATGHYAFHLTQNGHRVDLVDLVPSHIDQAKRVAAERQLPLNGYTVADCRALPFADSQFDAVIVHGPLYHLTAKPDRLTALKETLRILKPGGQLFAFAINRYAGAMFGIHTGQILEPDYQQMVRGEIASGTREREPGWHFHLPRELEQEVRDAGFQLTATKGVVGPCWMLPQIEQQVGEQAYFDKLLALGEMLEHEPIIGQDMLCIATKRLTG